MQAAPPALAMVRSMVSAPPETTVPKVAAEGITWTLQTIGVSHTPSGVQTSPAPHWPQSVAQAGSGPHSRVPQSGVQQAPWWQTWPWAQQAPPHATKVHSQAPPALQVSSTPQVPQEVWQANIYPSLPVLDYFIPSLPEARAITGLEELTDMALAFQDRGCKNVVIKLDERGVFCRDAAGTETLVPSYKVKNVVDTTGAGDSWSAGFLAGLYHRMDIPDADKEKIFYQNAVNLLRLPL